MITYEKRTFGKVPAKTEYVVRLDRRMAGRIRPFEGGYRYEPKGALNSMMGETLPTVAAVKASIEGAD